MNLTTAISIVNDGVLVGPHKGCPILYIKDEDNPDQFQALNTKEFYEYIKKQGYSEMYQAIARLHFIYLGSIWMVMK